MRCPNCGESNEPGARFCFNCGAELAVAAPAIPPAPAPSGQPVTSEPAPTPDPPVRPVESTQPYQPASGPDRPVWPPLGDTAARPGQDLPSTPVNPGDTFVFPPPPAAPQPPQQQAAPPPPFAPPPPLTPSGSSLPPQYPDWRMGGGALGADPIEPDPPRRGRNRFLMVVLGLLLGCLILCVALFVYSITPSGQDFFEDVGTSIADVATETADNS